MADNTLIQLYGDFGAHDGINEAYLDLGLVIGSSSIISCYSLLGRLSLEIEEFIKLIEHLLAVLFLSLRVILLLTRRCSLAPELLLISLLSPLITWHRTLI